MFTFTSCDKTGKNKKVKKNNFDEFWTPLLPIPEIPSDFI